ncbi:hypothetical protein ACSBR1_016656 [Camellia fascicularis]
MAEKVTTMVLKVDLQCSSCYKKIKKILCKFPLNWIIEQRSTTLNIIRGLDSPEQTIQLDLLGFLRKAGLHEDFLSDSMMQ